MVQPRIACLLAVLVALVVAPVAHARTVASLGFDPATNGYGFPNYTNAGGIQNLTAAEMQRLFGPGVCVSGDGPSCVLTPQATQWMVTQNKLMADGHCEGFAVSSLIFLRGLADPSAYGAAKVSDLPVAGNAPLQSFIAYAYSFQALDSVHDTVRVETPKQVVARLVKELADQHKQFSLHIFKPDMTGGHSITPIAVDDLGGGKDAIQVYDNNFPRQTRSVTVDTKANTWSYTASTDPTQKAALYQGDGDSFTLSLENMDPGLPVQPCPFCKPGARAAAVAAVTPGVPAPAVLPTPAVGSAPTLVALRAGHLRGRHAHLAVGREGRSGTIGYDASGRFVHTLHGAKAIFPTQGGPKVWEGAPEPEYLVPSGRGLVVRLADAKLRGRDTEGLSLVGRGWHIGVDGIHATHAVRARVRTAADGSSFAFATDSPQSVTPTLRLGSDQGDVAYDFSVSPHGLVSGSRVGLGAAPGSGKLAFTPAKGPNVIDLRIERLRSDGTRDLFVHDGVTLVAGEPASIDYAAWAGGDAGITIEQAGVAPQTISDDSRDAPAPEAAPQPAADATPAPTTTTTSTPVAPPATPPTPPPAPTHLVAYVANAGNSFTTVTPIDVATATPGAGITVGQNPDGVVTTPDGRTVYAVNAVPGAGNLTPIDTATNTAGTGISGFSYPNALAITPDGSRVYVVNGGTGNFDGTTVTPVTTATGALGAPITVGTDPEAIAVTPDGTKAYVVNAGSNSVSVIATATNTVVATVAVGTSPQGIAISPDGATAYVTNGTDATVTPIATATNTAGTAFAVDTSPRNIVVTPDGATLFVSSIFTGKVEALDAGGAHTQRADITVGSQPRGLAITPDGTLVYVANSGGASVTPITVSSLTAGPSISGPTIGSYPVAVAFAAVP